jgi:RND family efflux transporter MFP subunit
VKPGLDLWSATPGAICFGACLLAAGLLGGCRKPDVPDAPVLVTVQAEKPRIGPIAEHLSADAVLSPLAQAAIAPKITAPVRRFYVMRGSRVREGQLLAVLENSDLSAQLVDSKGQLEAAQATYSMETRAQLPEEYRRAELDLAQAQAQCELQESIVAARRQLLAEGAIPGRDYDTAAAALVQARAALDVARNHFASLQNVSREAALKQATGQLASARGKYLAAEAQVSYSEIRSPISGVVTDRPLFAGETAASGAPLITIMGTSSLLAKVHLAQTAAQHLRVGEAASILIPGVPGPVPATIFLISPALDPGSTTIEVWLRHDNRDGRYKAGTPVQTLLEGRKAERAVIVPLSAVLTATDGEHSVMVIGGDGLAHARPVELGLRDGALVQVTRGLSGSEMVITTGSYGLEDGTRVAAGRPAAGEGEGR